MVEVVSLRYIVVNHQCMLQVVSSTVKPIPVDAIPEANPNSPLTAEPTRRSHPMLCLPPVFTRLDTTFPYHFRAFMRRNLRTDLQWLPKSRVAMLAWDDPVPPAPSEHDPALVKVCDMRLVELSSSAW